MPQDVNLSRALLYPPPFTVAIQLGKNRAEEAGVTHEFGDQEECSRVCYALLKSGVHRVKDRLQAETKSERDT